MPDHLFLALDAPAVSFGGEAIDNYGVVRDFPARSMLTGLIANALGYDRSEAARLDTLQRRIIHASALVLTGLRSRDYQTARLFEKDAGWTTHGRPEGRASSPSFTWDGRFEAERGERRKSLTHQRYRDFDADGRTLVALHLAGGADAPDLGAVAEALARPERPLFLGRKPCLPSGPILVGRHAAPDALAALAHRMAVEGVAQARVQWGIARGDEDAESTRPGAELARDGFRVHVERRHRIADERRHSAGVHAGTRPVAEGTLVVESGAAEAVA